MRKLVVSGKYFNNLVYFCVIYFVLHQIAYFIFVIMFAYVTMQGEKNAKPGVAEMVLTLFVVSLTLEEINQVSIYNCCVSFGKYCS